MYKFIVPVLFAIAPQIASAQTEAMPKLGAEAEEWMVRLKLHSDFQNADVIIFTSGTFGYSGKLLGATMDSLYLMDDHGVHGISRESIYSVEIVNDSKPTWPSWVSGCIYLADFAFLNSNSYGPGEFASNEDLPTIFLPAIAAGLIGVALNNSINSATQNSYTYHFQHSRFNSDWTDLEKMLRNGSSRKLVTFDIVTAGIFQHVSAPYDATWQNTSHYRSNSSFTFARRLGMRYLYDSSWSFGATYVSSAEPTLNVNYSGNNYLLCGQYDYPLNQAATVELSGLFGLGYGTQDFNYERNLFDPSTSEKVSLVSESLVGYASFGITYKATAGFAASVGVDYLLGPSHTLPDPTKAAGSTNLVSLSNGSLTLGLHYSF